MYTLIRSLPASELALRVTPTLGASLVIAEAFYKFHSFTLEALAFLATWFILDAGFGAIRTTLGTLRRWLSAS